MNRKYLKDKLEEFIYEHQLSEYEDKTLTDYRQAINIFIDFIPSDSFELNKELLLQYKAYLNNKYQTASYNKYITILNKFLKYLGYKDLFLRKIKVQQKTSIDDPVWEQEHKRMLRWAKKLEMYDMYLIMKTFACTGIRVQELEVFKVETLDTYMKVHNKGKDRIIILRNDLKREILQYCKQNQIKEGYIFRSPVKPDKMLNPSTIWRRLKKIAGYAKINKSKIKPHAWRHLFAKEFKKQGGDLDELRDILGHSSLETTSIYTRTSNKEKRLKMEKMKL